MDIFSRLGADNIVKILTALTTDDNEQSIIRENISTNQQKWYIKRHSDSLSHATRITIGNIIKMNGKLDEIKECSDGLIINLDNLSDNIIEQVYIFVYCKYGK